ncbi:MAG: D-2-hydroxyacid dehydrogenase [Candidatus Sungbacteria bacterium]|nr:D-2-hydroxyacid dehydrogenase [Candidatus Sungbacteria bacterium]
MKILICAYQKTITKAGAQKVQAGLRAVTKAHVKKIKTIDKDIEVIVTADASAAVKYAADADIIVGYPRTIPPVSGAKNLKWIHSFSAGMDRVLTPEVIKSPILVSNSSGVLAIPIAEHVMGYMLIFSRGFLRSLENQRKCLWKRDESLTELHGKTVLVVGMGRIGSEVARLSRAFGCHVIAVTRSGREDSEWAHEVKKASVLERVLPKADFVVSCLPYTQETHHLFDAKKFGLMKPSAYFINIGRGALVKEKDLIAALKKKKIAGAGLDVTEVEPLPASSPLWNISNVIITPHHSGGSEHSMDRAIDRFILNLKAFLVGDRLPNLVDKKLGY